MLISFYLSIFSHSIMAMAESAPPISVPPAPAASSNGGHSARDGVGSRVGGLAMLDINGAVILCLVASVVEFSR